MNWTSDNRLKSTGFQPSEANQPAIMNNMTNDTSTAAATEYTYHYAGAEDLHLFGESYRGIHGYLATVVCAFGIIANILNIVVLTRKNMISPTNWILSGLAVSDGLTMAAYLPFALRFYCLYGTDMSLERNTLGAIRYMLFFACFSVYVHTVSIWLTVSLALFRYICITYPRYAQQLCSLRRAKIDVFLTYTVTFFICIPNFVTLKVKGDPYNNGTLWYVGFKTDTQVDKFIHNFNFWIQAIIVKLGPCVGLTILSILIVQTMNKAERRRRKLHGNAATNGKCVRKEDTARERKTNRTTRMLLTVVVLFLLTEFPQGILSLLSGILPEHFVHEIYYPLGDIMDILALINNGINFILYCAMSKQFRDTFIQVFLLPLKSKARKFAPVPLSPPVTASTTVNTCI